MEVHFSAPKSNCHHFDIVRAAPALVNVLHALLGVDVAIDHGPVGQGAQHGGIALDNEAHVSHAGVIQVDFVGLDMAFARHC